MHWWISDWLQHDPVILGVWVFWVVVSIVLHELGHGVAALRCGDRTPVLSGHMTWNPLVHIPPMAWLMFLLFGITWGLMPVNPHNFRGRYDDAKVAFAGPAVNLALALLCCVADALWLSYGNGLLPPHVEQNIHKLFFIGVMLNVILCLFNLLPVPPLDGSRIAADFIPSYNRMMNSEQGAVAGLIMFMLLFSVGGRFVQDVGVRVAAGSVAALSTLLGGAWRSPF